MEGSPFLPLPEGLLIESVEQSCTQLVVSVISTRPEATCPGCGQASEHVRSQYQRTVKDVPSGGQHVVLRLHMRKFFCLHLCCQRKVYWPKESGSPTPGVLNSGVSEGVFLSACSGGESLIRLFCSLVLIAREVRESLKSTPLPNTITVLHPRSPR